MNDTALQYVLAAIVVLPLLGAVGALLPPPPVCAAGTPTRPCCGTA